MNAILPNVVRSRPVSSVFSPVVHHVASRRASLATQQQNSSTSSRSSLRIPHRRCIIVQNASDESPSASIDEAKLREEIIKIEVTEPVVEQKAESAALTVAAAAAFGAGIWAVLGRAKAEGKIPNTQAENF